MYTPRYVIIGILTYLHESYLHLSEDDISAKYILIQPIYIWIISDIIYMHFHDSPFLSSTLNFLLSLFFCLRIVEIDFVNRFVNFTRNAYMHVLFVEIKFIIIKKWLVSRFIKSTILTPNTLYIIQMFACFGQKYATIQFWHESHLSFFFLYLILCPLT